jgi:RNA polymerase-binding transcription factor DksA
VRAPQPQVVVDRPGPQHRRDLVGVAREESPDRPRNDGVDVVPPGAGDDQVAVHDKLQVTRADVERATTKLAEGSYGTCDACGEPIGEGRLEALPWAVLCVRDAGRLTG